MHCAGSLHLYALKFHITIHSSQFLVQRTLCILQLYLESLRKMFTTESNELSLCILQLHLESLRKMFTTESNELSLDC